jgi:hypothetical protein
MLTQYELFPNLPFVLDPSSYWQRYQSYLRSTAWKMVRKQTAELADYACQAGMPGCSGTGQECHHLTYLRWKWLGDRPGIDTIWICRRCHSYIHSHPQMSPDPANDNEEAIDAYGLQRKTGTPGP